MQYRIHPLGSQVTYKSNDRFSGKASEICLKMAERRVGEHEVLDRYILGLGGVGMIEILKYNTRLPRELNLYDIINVGALTPWVDVVNADLIYSVIDVMKVYDLIVVGRKFSKTITTFQCVLVYNTDSQRIVEGLLDGDIKLSELIIR